MLCWFNLSILLPRQSLFQGRCYRKKLTSDDAFICMPSLIDLLRCLNPLERILLFLSVRDTRSLKSACVQSYSSISSLVEERKLGYSLTCFNSSIRNRMTLQMPDSFTIIEQSFSVGRDLSSLKYPLVHIDQRLLYIQYTDDGRGWSLRCRCVIPRGVVVCVYVGEYITSKETRLRHRKYFNASKVR